MAKSHTNIVPGLPGSSAKAAQQIIKLLDESRAATYMHTFSHFTRSLAIWQAVLDQTKMAEWLDMCAGMERGIGPLNDALGILMLEASYNYQDILGSVYMLLSQGDKRLGQYFTPYNVSKMMAEINMSDLKPLESGQPPIKILEPTCGSGVMLLASAETAEERCPGMMARGEILFFGVDLDPLCVAMCDLNMRLHGIGRVARIADDPKEAEGAAADHSAGRLIKLAFQPARIVCGNALDPETEKLFAQENPWFPFTMRQKPAASSSSETSIRPSPEEQPCEEGVSSPIAAAIKEPGVLDDLSAASAIVEEQAVLECESSDLGKENKAASDEAFALAQNQPESPDAAVMPSPVEREIVSGGGGGSDTRLVPLSKREEALAQPANVTSEENQAALTKKRIRPKRRGCPVEAVQQELFSVPS